MRIPGSNYIPYFSKQESLPNCASQWQRDTCQRSERKLRYKACVSRHIILQLARLLKERAESLIKYISSMRDFIKNQVRHLKKRVPSHGGKNIAQRREISFGGKKAGNKKWLDKRREDRRKIVIRLDDQQRILKERYIVKGSTTRIVTLSVDLWY